jgi:hypothetical protein
MFCVILATNLSTNAKNVQRRHEQQMAIIALATGGWKND